LCKLSLRFRRSFIFDVERQAALGRRSDAWREECLQYRTAVHRPRPTVLQRLRRPSLGDLLALPAETVQLKKSLRFYLPFLLFFFLVLSVQAQNRELLRSLTLEDTLKIEDIGDVALAPGGEVFAFSRTYGAWNDLSRRDSVWLAPTADGAA